LEIVGVTLLLSSSPLMKKLVMSPQIERNIDIVRFDYDLNMTLEQQLSALTNSVNLTNPNSKFILYHPIINLLEIPDV
jgi:hypothetical protein